MTHFSPEITHLPVLVYLLSPPPQRPTEDAFPCHAALAPAKSWEIRSVCFLWLSLLLTVPFTLSAFDSTDDERITSRVLAIGKRALGVPSKEGEYAAIALARLLARSDGVAEMEGFWAWVGERLGAGGAEGDVVFVRLKGRHWFVSTDRIQDNAHPCPSGDAPVPASLTENTPPPSPAILRHDAQRAYRRRDGVQ